MLTKVRFAWNSPDEIEVVFGRKDIGKYTTYFIPYWRALRLMQVLDTQAIEPTTHLYASNRLYITYYFDWYSENE